MITASAGLRRLGRSLLYNPPYLARVDRVKDSLLFEKKGDRFIVQVSGKLSGTL